MSIKDVNTAHSKATGISISSTPLHAQKSQKANAWYKRWPGSRMVLITPGPSYWPLLFCLLIALAVRVWLTIHTQGFIDGDEALVGIQATHILRGERPMYFYNQPYMGSLEAYIMAGIFAITGPSVWALRAETILLSLVVVWLAWKLASALAETAQLPLHAKQWFMTIAALLAAIPPLYDTVLELRTLGGYVETFVLILLLLLSTLKLTNRRVAGASRRELAWRWAGIGFVVGLGLWVNPLIIYGILAAALWIAWDCVKAWKEARGAKVVQRGGKPRPYYTRKNETSADSNIVGNGLTPALRSPFRTIILPALASIPACIIGLTPALYWGAMNQWQNVTYVLQSGGNPIGSALQAQYPTRLDIFFGLTHLYTTCVGPRILSGALPGGNSALRPLYTPTLVLSGLCILTTLTLVTLSFVQPHPLLLRVRRLAALPLVFAGSVSIIFCVTNTAASGLRSCQIDLAGRYATPLMLVIPFFVATIFTVVVMLEAEIKAPDRLANDAANLEMRPDNDASELPLHGQTEREAVRRSSRAVRQDERRRNTTPASQRLSSLVSPGPRSQRAMLGLLVGFLILSVFLQVGLYGLSDAGSTFQSPYCTRAPANNDAIIAYMQREHIRYAWATNWIAYPIVFKTHESIIVSDLLPIIRHIPMLNRIPAYTEAVRHADRPSFLVLVKHNDPYPALLELLDAEQVTYHVARFPSQEGRDVLVVTPLNRTVSPFDAGTLLNNQWCL